MTKSSRQKKARQRQQLIAENNSTSSIKFEAQLNLVAGKDDGPPRFSMTPAYDGKSKLSVRGFDAPVVIELSTAYFERDKIKINAYHDGKRIVGHAEDQDINENGIFASGLLSKVNEDVNRIVQESQNRYPHEASIEASFPKASLVPSGKTVLVNGHQQTGPFYLARNAKITQIAILDNGADRTTSVSIAAEEAEEQSSEQPQSSQDSSPPNKEKKTMSASLMKLCEDKGLDYETVTAEQLQAALAESSATPEVTTTTQSEQTIEATQTISAEEIAKGKEEIHAEMRNAKVEERKRQIAIEALCAEYGAPKFEIEVDGRKQAVDLETHAIEFGWDANKTQLEAMHWKLNEKNAGGSVAIHEGNKYDRDADVIECALAISGGLKEEDIVRCGYYDERVVNLAMSSNFHGYKPSRLGRLTIKEAGLAPYEGSPANSEYGQQLYAAHERLKGQHQSLEASGFTTLSLPGIFKNVANKMLMAAYTREASFIPFVFGRTSASDFKVLYGFQLEGTGMLEKLAGDGEIKHGKVVENEYTKKLETYAKMLTWTRQDRINDDMGSLGRTSSMLGSMAFKAREYAASRFIIQPSTTFWNATATTANPVVNSFTAVTFGIDGMTTSHTNFTGIEDEEGLPISVGGGNILVPNVLEVPARQLANDTEIRNGDAGKQYISNPHAGTFSYLSTPWVNNAKVNTTGGGFTGLSAGDRVKTWYRFADPASAPAFEVLYLNGTDTPTIESDDSDFNTLGQEFRCFFDFGFGANDQRYAQRNIGA